MLNSLLIGGFIGASSLYRMLQLREGGGYVARSVGGVRVERDTPDPRRRMLHNVVDEMALASGVPAPEVYVLENEDGINAFAAGHTPANAAIAVTRGALLRLNRDQLQGVIAHEFSHILNGDMRLSIRLMGLVFGLMVVALAGRTLLRLARHSQRGAMPVFVLGARHRHRRPDRILGRPHAAGVDLAPTRRSCRRLGSAVHAQSGRADRGAGECGCHGHRQALRQRRPWNRWRICCLSPVACACWRHTRRCWSDCRRWIRRSTRRSSNP